MSYIILPVCMLGVLSSCGTGGVLTGGPKDETPPKIDSVKSSPFFKTGFFPKELELYFDEFIELRDPIKQVLISPPTKYIPQVKHRGKKVTFRFDDREVLRDNATYIINFGESVVDFREGNKLSNFNYVFSTGPVIDSLSLEGIIKDAITDKPEEGMIVGLYGNPYDSIVALEKPFYFVKTDKEGKFRFSNIRSDTFMIFALKDENVNYLYDVSIEKVAFVESTIHLVPDTNINIRMVASVADFPPRLRSTLSREYGKVSLVYSSKPDTIQFRTEPEIEYYRDVIGDSLHLYYNHDLDSFRIYTSMDSVTIKPKGKNDFLKKSAFNSYAGNISKILSIKDSLVLRFNYPVASFDSTLIYVQDSIGVPDGLKINLSASRKEMIIKAGWRFANTYTIELDSGSVTDVYGHVLDSVAFVAGFLNKDQLGGINLIISELDTNRQFVVHLKRNNLILRTYIISGKAELKDNLDLMHVEKYTLEIIEDINSNGKWDSGNYWKKSQPERIQIFETDRIRANWDNDIEVKWKYAEKPTEPESPDNRLIKDK